MRLRTSFAALTRITSYNLKLKCRSDAQRSNKQKERKKLELERQVFNADHFAEDGGFPSSLVGFHHFKYVFIYI